MGTWISAYLERMVCEAIGIVLNTQTGQTVLRANRYAIHKFKNAVIAPYFVERAAILDDEGSRKIPKLDDNTADYIRSGTLTSPPITLPESHELACMTLECGTDSVLKSLTAISTDCSSSEFPPETKVEDNHLLRLECGPEIVRGCTEWRPKQAQGLCKVSPLPSTSEMSLP